MEINPAWFGSWGVASSHFGLKPELQYAEGETISRALRGDGAYISEYLRNPESGFHFQIKVPSHDGLFPLTRGQSMDYCGVVYFPVEKDKKSRDYSFHPQGFKLPGMLEPGSTPLPAGKNFPLILLSHGYTSEFMVHSTLIRILVSHGFIVTAVFHGDLRYGEDTISKRDESSPARMERLVLRALSLKSALDTLETGPFAGFIDWRRVGGLGISFGGASHMLLNGAPLNHPSFEAGIFYDDRIKAVAAQVPYMGSHRFTLWDMDSDLWNRITTPWMGVSGTHDSMAPLDFTRKALKKLPGSSWLVSLEGEEHFMSARGLRVADTWILEFWKRIFLEARKGLDMFDEDSAVQSDIKNTLEIFA